MKDDFAMCPREGFPRLIRFVTDMPDHLVAMLDKETNVLTINKLVYDKLDYIQQGALIRTKSPVTEVDADYCTQ